MKIYSIIILIIIGNIYSITAQIVPSYKGRINKIQDSIKVREKNIRIKFWDHSDVDKDIIQIAYFYKDDRDSIIAVELTTKIIELKGKGKKKEVTFPLYVDKVHYLRIDNIDLGEILMNTPAMKLLANREESKMRLLDVDEEKSAVFKIIHQSNLKNSIEEFQKKEFKISASNTTSLNNEIIVHYDTLELKYTACSEDGSISFRLNNEIITQDLLEQGEKSLKIILDKKRKKNQLKINLLRVGTRICPLELSLWEKDKEVWNATSIREDQELEINLEYESMKLVKTKNTLIKIKTDKIRIDLWDQAPDQYIRFVDVKQDEQPILKEYSIRRGKKSIFLNKILDKKIILEFIPVNTENYKWLIGGTNKVMFSIYDLKSKSYIKKNIEIKTDFSHTPDIFVLEYER